MPVSVTFPSLARSPARPDSGVRERAPSFGGWLVSGTSPRGPNMRALFPARPTNRLFAPSIVLTALGARLAPSFKAAGISREVYDAYLNSDAWGAKRRAAYERASHCCEDCGSAGIIEAHHITYERFQQELDDDLLVLCQPCHAKRHPKPRCKAPEPVSYGGGPAIRCPRWRRGLGTKRCAGCGTFVGKKSQIHAGHHT